MSQSSFSKAADYVNRAKPNATSVHSQRRKPEQVRETGLQPIPTTNVSGSGKVLISPVASQAELQARRKSERLEIASTDTPVRNSTMRGDPYTCPELRTNPHRPGAMDAFSVPSRTSFRTPQPA